MEEINPSMEAEALRSVIHTGSLFERIVGASRLAGSFVFLGKKLMAKNMARYYQAWELRQKGKKFREIGNLMYISSERARTLVSYINFKIKSQKQRRISNELKELINKYSKLNYFCGG